MHRNDWLSWVQERLKRRLIRQSLRNQRSSRPRLEGLETRLAPASDFGDAPLPYPTLAGESGAEHVATGPMLGTTRDSEADGTHTALADGDGADEDGVTFGTVRVGQLDATVLVTVSGAPAGAKLDAWIDFDHDGNWGGPQERIASSVSVFEGVNTITFDVPGGALDGPTFARFRLSTAGGLGVGGLAADGEVEDQLVTIAPPLSGPGVFTPHDISGGAKGARDVFSADVDGDGDLDIVSASNFDATIAWYENEGNQFSTKHIVTRNADGASSVYAVDLDGDGDVDILSASGGQARIAWYENDGNESFTTHALSTTANGALDVYAADVDGDGDLDVLSVSFLDDKIFWYENGGNRNFTERGVTTGDGPMAVHAGDLDGDGDLDVVSVFYGDHKVAWLENDGNENFTEHVIDANAIQGQSVYVADLDGDGNLDVLAALEVTPMIIWYRNDGDGTFTPHILSNNGNAYSVQAADVDGDDDLDVVSTSGIDRIIWIENISSSSFVSHTVNTGFESPMSAFAIDIDGDHDIDVLSASMGDGKIAWHENNGQESFVEHDVDEGVGGNTSVVMADVDGDGDLDGLTASGYNGKIVWFENDGSQHFTTHLISAQADRASIISVGDLDGDGDLDILFAASIDTIAWYENNGNQTFTLHTISTNASFPRSLATADVDGDGDLDVLSASDWDNKIVWYENDGNQSFSEHVITTSANGAMSVCAADVDGDGDLDVLSASFDDDVVAWYENDGNQNFTPHTISNSGDGASTVYVADLDRDGDYDVLAASYRDGMVVWYENDGSENFTSHTIAVGVLLDSILTADMDGDGDLDVIFGRQNIKGLVLYENDGSGNFTPKTLPPLDYPYAGPVYPGDLDNDGDLDILVGTGAGVFWYENAGDFGDAPTSYPTTLAQDGARHAALGPTLGASRDSENDGQPSADATGDGAEDDGITFGTLPVSATSNTTGHLTLDLQNPDAVSNRLDAWIDFNHDGDWDDLGERIFTDFDLGTTAGSRALDFVIPAGALAGDTFARFRLSTAGGLAPTGAAADGEVEDYKVTLTPQVDLQVSVSDAGAIARRGGGIFYRLTYRNNSPSEATGVRLTMRVPADTTFLRAGSTSGWSLANGSPAGSLGTYILGNLAPGATGTLIFAVRVNSPLPARTHSVSATAQIADDGTGGETSLADNQGNDSTLVNTRPVGRSRHYVTTNTRALAVGRKQGALASSGDVDLDGLSAVLVRGPAIGTLKLNADGTFRYVPRRGFVGRVGFYLRAFDGFEYSDPILITIDVRAG